LLSPSANKKKHKRKD